MQRRILFLRPLLSALVVLCAVGRTAQAQTALPLNGSVNGSITQSGADQYYTLTVTADSDVTLTVVPVSSLAPSTHIYDPDGLSQVASVGNSNYGGTTNLTFQHVGSGATYFVRIYSDAGSGGYKLTVSTAAAAVANDAEPNDYAFFAAPLGSVPTNAMFPLVKTGHLGYSRSSYTDRDNYDWYSVTVPTDGDLVISTAANSGSLSVGLHVYDTDGATELKSDTAGYGGTANVTLVHVGPGTYYFFVYDNAGYGTYTLTTYLNPQTIASDSEPNDTITTAIDHVTASTDPANPLTKTGHIGYSRSTYGDIDRYDFYALTIPADGNLSLSVTPTSSSLAPALYFYDTDGVSGIKSNAAGYGSAAGVYVEHLGPGTYYALVYINAGYGGYTLTAAEDAVTLASDAEPNDVSTQPDLFPPLSTDPMNPTAVTGHIGFSRTSYGDIDGSDWYAVTPPGDGDLTISVVPSSSTLAPSVYFYDTDAASNRVSTAAGYGATAAITVPHVGSQPYYIRVGINAGYGSYTLKAALAEPAVAADTENNNTSKQAVDLGTLPTDAQNPFVTTGHLGFSQGSYTTLDYDDWYKVTVPQDGDLSINLAPSTGAFAPSVYFYDTDGASQIEGTTGGYGSAVGLYEKHVGPGTYYIRARVNAGYGGYTLTTYLNPQTLPNDTENDDTYIQSVPYGSLSGSKTGHLGYSRSNYGTLDRSDWYSFTTTGGNFSIGIQPTATLAVYFYLYAINGVSAVNLASTSTGYGSFGTLSYANLPAGTYYLQVVLNAGYGAYILNPITLSGTVAFDSVGDLTAVKLPLEPLTIDLRSPGGTTPLYTFSSGLAPVGAGSPNGTFSFAIPRGKYDVAIKNPKTLRSVVANVNATGGSAAIPGVTTLAEGDADDNNAVNFDDFIILLNAFGTQRDTGNPGNGYDPTADFTYDGKVNFDDFIALLNNFGTSGSP